jgi:hypothetical protein
VEYAFRLNADWLADGKAQILEGEGTQVAQHQIL